MKVFSILFTFWGEAGAGAVLKVRIRRWDTSPDEFASIKNNGVQKSRDIVPFITGDFFILVFVLKHFLWACNGKNSVVY